MSAIEFFFKTKFEKEKFAHNEKFLLFQQFLLFFENFLPFSSNLKLLSANTLSLEESKICCLGKG